MKSIRVLPTSVSSSIAAGEVVERAASVVKELIENSIDAGAKNIHVTVQGKYLSLIRVTDDGVGIDPEDMSLVCVRHATSKMKTNNILDVNSLGYRGEAIASIASFSRLNIISRTAESDCAFTVSNDFGNISSVRPSSGKFGTIVTVHELFSRHPGRLSFQKSDKTEISMIKNVIANIALCHKNICFIFDTGNNKDIIKYDFKDNYVDRCADILGGDFAKGMIPVDYEDDYIKIEGGTCLPSSVRKNHNGIYVSVNGRYVSNDVVKNAIVAVFSSLIGEGRYPQAFLSLTLPCDKMDINVHPRKHEIRFHDSQKVSTLVFNAVDYALRNASLNTGKSLSHLAKELSKKNETSNCLDKKRLPLGKFISQINNKWILSETADGMVMIDQHAAHERVVLERLKAYLDNIDMPMFSYPLAVEKELTFEESANADEMSNTFLSFGFDYSILNKYIYLNKIPSVLANINPEKIIDIIIRVSSLGVDKNLLKEALWEKVASASCKAAIKAGDKLSDDRADVLLREIENTPNAFFCNHGRPTVAFLNDKDISKLFER